MPYERIAFQVLRRYTAGVLDPDALEALCRDAYDYDVPLEPVYDRVHVMRLDRGPTASFKDFAARMMARLIGRFLRETGRELTILTATSGDTGSAVASAFHGVPGIRVIVLFPMAEVSDRQRRQMTTLRGNIRTVALDGKVRRLPGDGETGLRGPGAALDSAFLGQFDQHRPAVAAERLLLLRRVARGQARRTGGVRRCRAATSAT